MGWWVSAAVLGMALTFWNARVTARIWRSGVYERGQLIAQTAIVWLIPGSAFGIAAILKGGSPRRAGDPTASNSDAPNATIYGSGGGGGGA
jgi:hypothetical protein